MFAGTGVDGRSGEYRFANGCGDATDDEDSCGCDIRSQDEMRSEIMWFEDVWFEDLLPVGDAAVFKQTK